jgi:hypothetical protein
MIEEVIETREFAKKNDDGRNADRRLANRRLQPLGHLTALVEVYRTQVLTRRSFDDEGAEAARVQTVASDAKCNCPSALFVG